jgi:hypothetical protein
VAIFFHVSSMGLVPDLNNVPTKNERNTLSQPFLPSNGLSGHINSNILRSKSDFVLPLKTEGFGSKHGAASDICALS